MPEQHDLLLGWLSTVGSATHHRARQVADCLDKGEPGRWSVDRLFGELTRGAHVELQRSVWRVVAASLVWRSSRGELYGARDSQLRIDLAREGFTVEETANSLGAALWRVSGDKQHAEAACQRLAVRFATDRSSELLKGLPTGDVVLRGIEPLARQNPTEGRKWARFGEKGRWESERQRGQIEPGLWRSLQPSPVFLWCDERGAVRRLFQSEHRWLARWHALRECVSLRLESAMLSVPVNPRLPILIDRALRVASGGEVQERGDCYCYPEIGASRAREVARILGVALLEGRSDG